MTAFRVSVLPRLSALETPETTMTFGKWLRQERKRRGQSIYSIAEKAEVSTTAVSDWENEKRNPRRSNVPLIAAALVGANSGGEYEAMLEEVSRRAGFSTTETEIVTEKELAIARRLLNLPSPQREALLTLLDGLAEELLPGQSAEGTTLDTQG